MELPSNLNLFVASVTLICVLGWILDIKIRKLKDKYKACANEDLLQYLKERETALEYHIDVEIFNEKEIDNIEWVEAKYCIHGVEEEFWTNDTDEALEFLNKQIIKLKRQVNTSE